MRDIKINYTQAEIREFIRLVNQGFLEWTPTRFCKTEGGPYFDYPPEPDDYVHCVTLRVIGIPPFGEIEFDEINGIRQGVMK